MKIGFVIDNDKEFLTFTERHLTLLGYQVHSFPKADQFLASLKLNPQLIIMGDSLTKQPGGLDYIRQARKFLPQVVIILIAQSDNVVNAVNAVKAGATEFIEKNSAAFVRLRTCLDLLQKKNKAGISSLLGQLKKVFID